MSGSKIPSSALDCEDESVLSDTHAQEHCLELHLDERHISQGIQDYNFDGIFEECRWHRSKATNINEAKSMGSDDIFFYVKRDIKRIHPDEKHAINISQIDKVIKNLK